MAGLRSTEKPRPSEITASPDTKGSAACNVRSSASVSTDWPWRKRIWFSRIPGRTRTEKASFEILVKKSLGRYRKFFDLVGFRVIDEKRTEAEPPIAEATIMLSGPDGQIEHTAATGNGPVQALDRARGPQVHGHVAGDEAAEGSGAVDVVDAAEEAHVGGGLAPAGGQ